MDIKLDMREFDTVIHKYIAWIEDWAKAYELNRRLVAASAAKTEQERAEILSYSEAFAYFINVENGQISFSRIPPSSENENENTFIYETFTMFESILPEELNVSMGNAEEEIAEIMKPRLEQAIAKEIGGALTC